MIDRFARFRERDGRSPHRRRRLGRWLACAGVVAIAGCGPRGAQRDALPISGMVTLDGQPLKSGYVVFEPKGGQPTQSGGMISDGVFNVPAQHGAAPGAYSVAIFAEGETAPIQATPGTPEYEAAAARKSTNKIPPRYNFNTQLTAEVTRDGENHFAFELTSD